MAVPLLETEAPLVTRTGGPSGFGGERDDARDGDRRIPLDPHASVSGAFCPGHDGHAVRRLHERIRRAPGRRGLPPFAAPSLLWWNSLALLGEQRRARARTAPAARLPDLPGARALAATGSWERCSRPANCWPGASSRPRACSWPTNPHSSFFYVLDGVHGLHLAGGLVSVRCGPHAPVPHDAPRARTAWACSRRTGATWRRCGSTWRCCCSSSEGEEHARRVARRSTSRHWQGGVSPFGTTWQRR